MSTTMEAERTGATALLADEYLTDLIYRALLERGEAAKASEITLEINNPNVTVPVVRRILSDSPRFLSVDRLWNLSARYLDTSRPTERNLLEVLKAAGRPLSTAQLATELSAVYHREPEVYLSLLAKLANNAARYLRTGAGEILPVDWLPLVDSDDEEDILFDNELTRAEIDRFTVQGIDWKTADYATPSRRIVEAAGGTPVPHRVLGVLAWRALKGKYDPRKHMLACLADTDLVWMSGGRWIAARRAEELEALIAERGIELAEEATEEPVEEIAPVAVAEPEVAPVEAAAELAVEAPAVEAPAPAPVRTPLAVSDEDLTGMEQIISDRGAAVDSGDLLALQFEVVPGDPSYREDLETLTERLKGNERFQYVGAGRFREPNSLPLFVYSIPEFLAYPDLEFVSLEGEIMDEEIEDEGFVGSLRNDVLDPRVQDAGDDEGEYTGTLSAGASGIRLVLKNHHKEIGTFPLAQVPDGFFPTDADVVEVVVKDPTGTNHDVIVNNDIRLMFNLFGLYDFVPADSGGTFMLEKGARPYEYRFVPSDETDPEVFVNPARMAELGSLREQADESGDMATFDILCEILAHYPKGLTFVGAMTEVNIVRRVTRRKLASILSNYYCFAQKAGTNLWRFDAKKRDLGTDRAKRKYLKR